MLYSGQWNAATTLKKARNTHCSAGIAHSARWSACGSTSACRFLLFDLVKQAKTRHCSAGIAHSARWSACSASAFDGRTAGAPAACWTTADRPETSPPDDTPLEHSPLEDSPRIAHLVEQSRGARDEHARLVAPVCVLVEAVSRGGVRDGKADCGPGARLRARDGKP